MKPQLVTILGLALLYVLAGCNRKNPNDDIDATDSASVQVSPESEDNDLQDVDTTGGSWGNTGSQSQSQWQTQNSDPNTPSWSNPNGFPFNGYVQNGQSYNYPTNYQTSGYNYFPNQLMSYDEGLYAAAVVAQYRRIGRNPDLPGLRFWLRELVNGRPYTDMITQVLASPEIQFLGSNVSHIQNVTSIVRVYTGRLPTPGSLYYGVQQLVSGVPLTGLIDQLMASIGYYQQGYYSRSIVDVFRYLLGRDPNYNELQGFMAHITAGNPYTGVITQVRALPEFTQIGGDTAVNCIALHRVVTGKMPPRAELARCVSMGANSAVTAPNFYNATLKAYAQQLLYQPWY